MSGLGFIDAIFLEIDFQVRSQRRRGGGAVEIRPAHCVRRGGGTDILPW